MPEELKSTKTSQVNFWANSLLVIGLLALLLLSFLIYQRYNPQKLSFTTSTVIASEESSVKNLQPTAIKIDSINLLLPIIPAKVDNNQWEATTKGISYLSNSAIPGKVGNSILYGHNWPNLLGNLNKTKPGDTITIIYNDNTYKNFHIEYAATVSPNNTSILQNSTDQRLTLYTCTGFLDTKRLVIVAKFTNNETRKQ